MFSQILAKLGLYTEMRIRLAMEYGVVLSDVAKDQGITLTQNDVVNAEEMFIREAKKSTTTQLACGLIPNIISLLKSDEESS